MAAVAVVAVFALAMWASPVAAAVVVVPLALLAAAAAASADPFSTGREATRGSLTAGLDRQVRNGRKLAILDPQTALLQRWYFELRVADEARRCRRYGLGMAVLFVKIEGEEVCKDDPDWTTEVQIDLVQVLARTLRAVDLASRTAEREFAVCLPHTGAEGARIVAGRIAQNSGSYTVTTRVAAAPEDGLDYDSLYEKAEEFTPSEPADSSQQDATTQPLVQLLKTAPFGEMPLAEGQTPRSARARLRRASKRAGVDIRIWEEDGSVRFERIEKAPGRGSKVA